MRKRTLISLLLTAIMILTASGIASAASWQFYFPITVSDNSSTTRTAYPIILEVGGQHLVDGGYLTANGTDARLRTTADKNLMMSTDNIVFVVDSLPAYGQVTYNLHTGYSPEISAFQIIVGDGGYVTVADNTTIELGDNFTSEQSGWVDTVYSVNKTLIFKEDAFNTYISDNETITSIILKADARTYQVNAGTDDIEKHWNGAAWVVDNAGVAIYAGWIAANAEDYGCGMRFKNVLLSQGQLISAANITFTSGGNQANAVVRTRLQGQDSDNASTFSDLADFDARPRTSANLTWDNIGAWTTDNEFDSIDIASIIQEIVNRPGWVSGNSIVIFWEDFESRSTEANDTERIARSFDSDPAKAAQLNITASTVTATGVASGKHIVRTEAGLATGDLLHFDGSTNSYMVCVAGTYDSLAKFWLYMQFRLDSTHQNGSSTTYLWSKYKDANEYIYARFTGTGTLQFGINPDEAGGTFINTVETVWNADQWYEAIFSLSDTDGMAMIVNDGTPVTNADARGTPAGVNYLGIGKYDGAPTDGIVGEIGTVIVGTDNLTVVERTNLFNGVPPGDETDYWLANEGTGTAITSYGSVGTAGLAGTATSWEESVRPHWFSIQVDSTLEEETPLEGASVPDNANDWTLLQNNVMPYADNITITVNGTRELWFEPNEMITGTTLPDRATSVANDGTITWGANDQVTIVFGSVTSYEATTSAATVNETGWVLPLVGIPDNWWGMEFDGSDLPFYAATANTSAETGIPVQTLYLFWVFGVAIALATVTIVLTRSVLVGVAFYTVTMAYGANAGIVAWWIIYVFLIMVIGIVFLSSRQAMGG